MSKNKDTTTARHYHHGTNHPDGFLIDYGHRFYRQLTPLLFKKYKDLSSVELKMPPGAHSAAALDAIAVPAVPEKDRQVPGLEVLTDLLYYSAGVTKRIRYPGYGEMYFRAAACTGALYHIELYLCCGDLPGLAAGLYHFDPAGMRLDVLRKGDFRQVLLDAAAGAPGLTGRPAILIYTDVFGRNSCKYQARAYRHSFWDSGTILAHTLAVAAGHGLPHHLVLGFVDETVDRLLDLDRQREASLALIGIGYDPDALPGTAPPVEDLGLQTEPISDFEIDFPPILEMHRASALHTPEEVVEWRNSRTPRESQAPAQSTIQLRSHRPAQVSSDSLEAVIRRRGSSRQFSREPLTLGQLSVLLQHSTQGIPADFGISEQPPLGQIYLSVHAIEGLEPGAYVYDEQEQGLVLLKTGNFRSEARYLAFDQALGGDCAAAIYFLCDLEPVLAGLGNRGYRAAQLEASLAAGKMYLAAYAQGFGATGLTFNDNAITRFFSPNAAGKSVMFLVAIGVPGRRK